MAACLLCKKEMDLNNPHDYAKPTEKDCIDVNNANRLRNLYILDILYSEKSDFVVHKECRLSISTQNSSNLNSIIQKTDISAPIKTHAKASTSDIDDLILK